MTKKYALIPFGCGAGAGVPGCEKAAVALYNHGLETFLQDNGINARWYEDPLTLYNNTHGLDAHENLPSLGTPERHNLVLWHCRHMRDRVIKAIEEGFIPVTLGGDHTMAAASLSGLAKAENAHGNIGLLWIDAHPDLNTWETTPSQTLHGMPVAALLGLGDQDLKTLAGNTPVLKPQNLFMAGLRSIDPGEQEVLSRLDIPHALASDMKQNGIKETLIQAYDTLTRKTDYFAISIDLDSIDPSQASAVSSPVPDGLDKNELIDALKGIKNRADIRLIEIAEYNPALNGEKETYRIIQEILKALL